MRRESARLVGLGAAVLVVASGCSTTDDPPARVGSGGEEAVALMPGPSTWAPSAARPVPPGTPVDASFAPIPGPSWEATRNDRRLGLGAPRRIVSHELFEVRTFDRRRTTNGRVRESSRSTTRVLQRGRLRSN